MPKTIHTPETPKMLVINFNWAEIDKVNVDAANAAHVDFGCPLGKGYEKLFDRMGWQIPEGSTSTLGFKDAKLEGGTFILSSKDKLIDCEIDCKYKTATNFHCERFELKGKKGKGFRRELRFRIIFEDLDGPLQLLGFLGRIPDGNGTLKLHYLEAPAEQMEIRDDDDQVELDEVRAKATSAMEH